MSTKYDEEKLSNQQTDAISLSAVSLRGEPSSLYISLNFGYTHSLHSRGLSWGENNINWRLELGQHTLWIDIGTIIANDDDDIVVCRSYCGRLSPVGCNLWDVTLHMLFFGRTYLKVV